MGAVKRALKLIRRRPWEQCDRYEMEALWKSDRYHNHSLSLLRHQGQNVTQGSMEHKSEENMTILVGGEETQSRFAAIRGRDSQEMVEREKIGDRALTTFSENR